MDKAAAIVAMGGYNTFCEILSLDKRALIVPRTHPRLEQHIRAVEAERLGLVRMLSEDRGKRDPRLMAAALRQPAEPAAAVGRVHPGAARRARRHPRPLRRRSRQTPLSQPIHQAAE